MGDNTLGKLVLDYRKQTGLTQGELGDRLGVSAQAVSRWEHGGVPDTALLPKLAKLLSCSLDDLYGLSTTQVNIEDMLTQEILRLPVEQRVDRAFQLMWHLSKTTCAAEKDRIGSLFDAATTCEDADLKPNYISNRSPTACYFDLEDCIAHASTASDFKYLLFMPEPSRGFNSILSNAKDYQQLFALFSKDYRLETFLLSYTLPRGRSFSRDYICYHLKISETLAQEILDELCQYRILDCKTIQVTDHYIEAYSRPAPSTIIPLLYFANSIMRNGDNCALCAPLRNKPLLSVPLDAASGNAAWKPSCSREDPPKTIWNV